MKLRFRILCLLLAAGILCCGCTAGGSAEKAQKYSAVFYDAFDTVTSVIGYADSQKTFDRIFGQIQDMFMYYHRIYDGYRPYDGVNNLYFVNRNAAQGPVKAEPELIELLLYMKDLQPKLNGRVNIAMGSVLGCWHEMREEGESLPETDLLRKLNEHTDFDDVIIDENAGTVYFADPGLSLDLGAVAKGYTTEIVASWLLTSDMPSYIISAGGNVRCGLAPLDGRARWGVGIQDPDASVLPGANTTLDAVYLKDASVVTSGDYQRYYTVDGIRYHHIIDPDTLFPSDYMRQITIVTRDSGYADALSTALFLMPYEEGRAFVDGLEGVEAYWVLQDGTVHFTDGLAPYLKSQGGSAVD